MNESAQEANKKETSLARFFYWIAPALIIPLVALFFLQNLVIGFIIIGFVMIALSWGYAKSYMADREKKIISLVGIAVLYFTAQVIIVTSFATALVFSICSLLSS